MNARTDEWEHYTDGLGRRHWRWPASDVRDVRMKVEGQRKNVPLPEPARARETPSRSREQERSSRRQQR